MLLSRKQDRDIFPIPSPPPCPPVTSASNVGTGAIDLGVSNPNCPGAATGYRIYRAPTGGTFALIADIGASVSFRDYSPRRGVSYRYVATMYNGQNEESAFSAEVSITALDTTAPVVPIGLSGTPGDQRATLAWNDNYDSDLRGYNIYMSTTSGGPYTKLNVTPIGDRNPHWVQMGLNNGQNYYFVATAVDVVGNESTFSGEVIVTPSP